MILRDSQLDMAVVSVGPCVERDLPFVLFKCVFESAQSKEEQDYDTKNANSLVISEGKKNGKVQKDDEASFE